MVSGHRVTQLQKHTGIFDGLNGIDIWLNSFKERWKTHIGRAVTPGIEISLFNLNGIPSRLVSDICVLASKHFWGDALCNGCLHFFVARPNVFQEDRVAIFICTD